MYDVGNQDIDDPVGQANSVNRSIPPGLHQQNSRDQDSVWIDLAKLRRTTYYRDLSEHVVAFFIFNWVSGWIWANTVSYNDRI